MMFCSSMAAGFIYWGSIEWVFHYIKPPFGINPLSPEAADYAATLPIFYWGISAWGVYLIPAVAFAFLRYNLKNERFDVAIACKPLLGKHADEIGGKMINILFLFGILGGIGVPLWELDHHWSQPVWINFSAGMIARCCVLWSLSWSLLFFPYPPTTASKRDSDLKQHQYCPDVTDYLCIPGWQ